MKTLTKVLHVDDDEDIRMIALMALEVVGQLTVHQCASGAAAIAQAKAFGPDLLLLDYMMPEMSGEDTWRALREMPGMEHVPAIFMTARVQPDVAKALLAMGALAVIPKPFDPMELAAQLHEAWGRHLAMTSAA